MLEPVRILILEDDESMRRSLAQVLSDEGYQVVAVGRGTEAVERAHEQPVDIVVADIRMAGMDGLTALERVQAERPDIQSIVITGYSTEADSIRAIHLGVSEYLKKPFRLETFLEAVGRLVARRRQEQRLAAHEQSLRRTALLALEALGRALDAAQPLGKGVVAAGRLAARLALLHELPEPSSEEVQLATLVAAVERRTPLDPQLAEQLPVGVRRLLEGLEGQEEDVPLGARLAALALAAAEEDAVESVERRFPGRFEPQLLEALRRATEQGETSFGSGPEAGRRRRGLLSLAQALAQSDEPLSAIRAFESVLSCSPQPSREGVEALLGLARLQTEKVREHAGRAVQQALHVSPSAYARACLEAGLMVGGPDAPRYLEQSLNLFSQLRLPGPTACARLALTLSGGSLEPSDLAVLAQAEHSQELVRSAFWLVPLLLERQATNPLPEGERLLLRVARELPGHLARPLTTGELSPPGRVVAVRALAAGQGAAAEEALRQLALSAEEPVRGAAATALATLPGGAVLPVLRLYSMGPFEVYRGDERIPDRALKSQKIRFFLACVASHGGHPVSEELLVEEFWPEDPEKGRQSLYSAMSVLRRALTPPGVPGEPQYILRSPRGLSLNPDLPRWHDLEELEAALAPSAPADTEQLRRLSQLYRGAYLEGCYLDWAQAIRSRLERSIGEALRRLAASLLQQSRPLESLDCSYRLLELDPCCQEAYLLSMHANLALGRAEEAVRLFKQGERVLRRELAMEPSIAMIEAHQRALLSLS